MKTNNITIKVINIILSIVAVCLMVKLYLYDFDEWLYLFIPVVTVILSCLYKRFASFSKLYIKVIFDVLLILAYGVFLFLIIGGFIYNFDNWMPLPVNMSYTLDLSALLALLYIVFKIFVVSILRLFENERKTKLFLTTASTLMIILSEILFIIIFRNIFAVNLQTDNLIYFIMFLVIGLISTYDFKTKKPKKM